MEMNESSIRIREIDEKDLEWSDYVDVEKEDLTVPCFNGTKKFRYTGFLKPSLDLLYFRNLCKKREKASNEKCIFRRNDVEYTDVFILVNMNGSGEKITMEEDEDPITAGYLYCYGIYQREDWDKYVKYVEYKRSGNAAKKGKHIFIREDFYLDMMKWSWLGYSPKDLKVSLPYVEMKAYESLVNSNIKGTVKIEPDEILLLEDKEHTFQTKIAKIREEQGKFFLNRCEDDVTNKVFDGECLLDNSVFESGDMDAGMMLLRNFFFKSCGFRTDIQGYYKEIFGVDYKNARVQDCFGNWIEIKKIKMIVTTSSFKVFKFKKYFGINQLAYELRMNIDDIQMEEAESFYEEASYTYDLWRRKVKENGNVFGVVKHEEVHREKRKFTYQMINSMNFSENDIRELMEEDIKKFVELRTNYEAYEAYIEKGRGKDGGGNPSYTEHFIIDLVKKNPVFRQTDLYKEKRSNDMRAFKQKLYEGKLSIEADYYTLCSMPWELLQYSVKPEEAFLNPVLKKGEICIAGLKEGEQITLCRNPHTCASNVVCATNRRIPEIEKWFYFTRKDGFSNIVVISPWEWDVMEALNGADFDSDEVLCIKNKIVLERAMELGKSEQISAIPHVEKDSDSRGTVETGDFLKQYEIDCALSGNKIGTISNYVQVLNGYYWDSFHEGSRFTKRQEELYDDIQILSVLMGLEIDKAKHAYSFDAQKTAEEILNKYHSSGKNSKWYRYRPIFMCFINKNRHKEAVKKAKANFWLNCPMDYVAKRLYYIYDEEEQLKNLKQTPTVSLENVFQVSDYKGCDAHKVETVLDKMDDCIRRLKSLNMNKADLDWAENDALKTSLLDDTYRLMEKNKISLKEMKRMLYLILEKDLTEKMKRRTAGKAFYECLLVNNQEVVSKIIGTKDTSDFSSKLINKASTEFIEQAKKSGDRKQINYSKCNKMFEKFLDIDFTNEEEKDKFASQMKKDKNLLNVAYMLQIVSAKRNHCATKNDKLMSLAILYHVWPEFFMECVQNAKN